MGSLYFEKISRGKITKITDFFLLSNVKDLAVLKMPLLIQVENPLSEMLGSEVLCI